MGIPCGLDFEATQCPNPPSYVPRVFTDNTDHMTFLQRVKNLLYDIPDIFHGDFAFQPYSKLASEFLQWARSLQKASIWLLRLDLLIDYLAFNAKHHSHWRSKLCSQGAAS
ncbi:UDP-glucuronosyltransferase 1-1, partial [Lamprotornis superbus]